jgi:hypothetical protein
MAHVCIDRKAMVNVWLGIVIFNGAVGDMTLLPSGIEGLEDLKPDDGFPMVYSG